MEAPEALLNDLTNLYRDINDELVSINFDAIDLDFNSDNYNGVSDFASAFAEQLKKRADRLINSENDVNSQEGNFITYIFFRYNECVLWDLSGNEEKFQDSLLKLNTGLTSRIIDDSCASEKLFLYVAELNFKVHNYSVARRFVEKSIKLENRQEDGAENVPLRFHKRCLQAFCYEYSFVPGASGSKCLKSNSLIDAVNCLIGRNPKDFVGADGRMVDEFKKVIKDCNHGNIEATDIIAKIYNPSTDSLAKKFYDSYVNYLPSDQHEEYIKKIAHILAHCFSEIHRWAALDYLNVNYESIYLFSMAEILMKSLGDEYITCYSTVLLENDQHIPAIEEMISVREKHQSDWATGSMVCELAQIDFYIWYLSVIAKKFADRNAMRNLDKYISQHKRNFELYKSSHESDYSARTYYELLSMKEELIQCFAELKSGDFSKRACSRLIESYKNFSPSSPKKNIHKDIQVEWNMLNFAYYIFLSCYRYNSTHQDWYLFDIEDRLLSQNVYEGLEPPKSKDELIALKQNSFGRNYKSDETQKHIYCEITLPYGKFLYIGSDEVVVEKMLAELGVDYKVEAFSDDCGKKSIENSLAEISNILFIYSDANKEYLRYLCRYSNDRELIGENKPNVFIYDGLLNINSSNVQNQISVNNREIEQIIVGCHTFRKMDNLKTVIQYCAMFSALESCISRIYKPLNTLVISPIESVKAYSDQSVEDAIFLRKSEVGSLKPAQKIAYWSDGFKACFSKTDKKIKAKCMRLGRLSKDDLSKIEAVLLIEYPKNILINSKIAKTRTNIFTFDNFTSENIISMGASITAPYDERSRSGDVVYSSAMSLYDSRKPRTEGKVHGDNCTNKGYSCCSVFYNSLYQPGELTDEYYSDFIDVLYSYNLLKKGTLDKVAVKEGNYAITKTRTQDIVFCIFKDGGTISSCENFCKVMNSCISDAKEEDYLLAEECSEQPQNAQQQSTINSVDEADEESSSYNAQDIQTLLVQIHLKVSEKHKQLKDDEFTSEETMTLLTDTLDTVMQYLSDINEGGGNLKKMYEWIIDTRTTLNSKWGGLFK